MEQHYKALLATLIEEHPIVKIWIMELNYSMYCLSEDHYGESLKRKRDDIWYEDRLLKEIKRMKLLKEF